uniref:Uncharacterized protein n=1 Tax=Physcomitrium patens TaxID=3218 RepID=A0A2K1KJG8_PHYPA|nr:hypothetical protein PHYPA_007596 [Physcomitrium patens]
MIFLSCCHQSYCWSRCILQRFVRLQYWLVLAIALAGCILTSLKGEVLSNVRRWVVEDTLKDVANSRASRSTRAKDLLAEVSRWL